MTTAYGIDIGGSGIKGAPVDLDTGTLTSERRRIPTPTPSTPSNVINAVAEIIDHHRWQGPLGVTVPGVVINGIVRSVANIDAAWTEFDASSAFTESLGMPVEIINDADAAGIAEARFGEHDDLDGVTLVLTFGTGIGSAIIHDGVLVPNFEFGHLEIHGMEAEKYAASRLIKRDNRDIEWWALRVNEVLQHLEVLVSPRRIIFGGGISKRFDDYSHLFETTADVVPARLRNNAGIVGAAMIAASREQR